MIDPINESILDFQDIELPNGLKLNFSPKGRTSALIRMLIALRFIRASQAGR